MAHSNERRLKYVSQTDQQLGYINQKPKEELV